MLGCVPGGDGGSRSPWRSPAWRWSLAAPADASVLGPRRRALAQRRRHPDGLLGRDRRRGAPDRRRSTRSSWWRWFAFGPAGGGRPQRLTAGPGAFLRPAVPLAAIAIGLFVFGIVITSDARDVQPTDRPGAERPRDLVAQAGGLSGPTGDAKPLEINVVGQRWLWRFDYPQRPTSRRTRTFSYNELVGPGPHHRDPPHHLDRRRPSLVRARAGRPGRRRPGPRVRHLVPRGSRRASTAGSPPSFSGTSYAVMRAWVKVVSPRQYQQFIGRSGVQIAAAQDYVQKAVRQGAATGAATP